MKNPKMPENSRNRKKRAQETHTIHGPNNKGGN